MARAASIVLGLAVVAIIVAGVYYYTTTTTTPARPGEKQFSLTASDFFFSEGSSQNPELRVNEGDTVTITLRNQGGKEHELVIVTNEEYQRVLDMAEEMAGMEMEHELAFNNAEIEDLRPGETKSTTFTVDKPGTYVYACFETDPKLHAELGMFGKFTVVPVKQSRIVARIVNVGYARHPRNPQLRIIRLHQNQDPLHAVEVDDALATPRGGIRR